MPDPHWPDPPGWDDTPCCGSSVQAEITYMAALAVIRFGKKATMRKFLALAAAVTMAAGITVAAAWPAGASEGGGHQFVNSGAYINAWGGGPNVEVYTAPALYNDFTIINNPDGTGYVNIQLTGGTSPYDNYCIGDLGDSQTSGQAGFVGGCGSTSIGWGGNFTWGACDGNAGLWFKNVRHGGYLAVDGTNTKGTPFYVDLQQTCFDVKNPF